MRNAATRAAVPFGAGLGIGAAVSPSLGPVALWSGIVVAAIGVAFSVVGTRESNLVGDGLDDRDEDSRIAGDPTNVGTADVAEPRRRNRQRPTLSGMGTRVEQILKLAEEQANDHRTTARREADGILTAARREADAILNRAHDQAAGITGARQDLSPAPFTGTPSPDDGSRPHV